jgi:hypothetical protein
MVSRLSTQVSATTMRLSCGSRKPSWNDQIGSSSWDLIHVGRDCVRIHDFNNQQLVDRLGFPFIANATGATTDTVAHAAILTIAAVPDVLAVLLLVAAGYLAPKAPAVRRRMARRRKAPRRTMPAAGRGGSAR